MMIVLNILKRIINKIYKVLLPQDRRIIINASLFQCGPYVKHFNIGDDLNVFLIEKLTKKKVLNYSGFYKKKCENYLCIGSIIEPLTDEHSIIWGAGAMYGGMYPLKRKPKKVVAVRGPLTRNYLIQEGVDCPPVYGDPALLLPIVYMPKVKKKYKIGIIPHFVDIDNSVIQNLLHYDGRVKLIKIQSYRNWKTIINEINECDFIISSSLHGIIISDAYNIPNVWVEFSDKVEGNGFKFRDYFLSVGRSYNNPVRVSLSTNIEDLEIYKSIWEPIKFNSQKLIKSCPFPLCV